MIIGVASGPNEIIVDDSDLELIRGYDWFSFTGDGKRWYAVANIDGKYVRMHRLLTGAPDGLDVDHENGNTMDNRRSNLRICTRAQNNRNRSGSIGTSVFKGVTWKKDKKKWQAKISINGRNKHLGYFDDETEAALTYDKIAKEVSGDFAYLNFKEELI